VGIFYLQAVHIQYLEYGKLKHGIVKNGETFLDIAKQQLGVTMVDI